MYPASDATIAEKETLIRRVGVLCVSVNKFFNDTHICSYDRFWLRDVIVIDSIVNTIRYV